MKVTSKTVGPAKGATGDFKKGQVGEESGWTLARPQIVARMRALSEKGLERLLPMLPQDAVGRELENGFELVSASGVGKSLQGLAMSLARPTPSFDELPTAGLLVYATSSLTYAVFFSEEKRVAVRAVVSRMGEDSSWEKLVTGIEEAAALGLKKGYAVFNLGSLRAYDESGRRVSQP